MSHALLLDGVSKSYAGHAAVKHLSLTVPTGTIYGILGPNGAGKSTTLRMVMNIIIRDAGTIQLLGADPERDPRVLSRVGYLPEERGLYKKMSVIDVITFFAELKGVARATAVREGERWLERMGLADWRNAKVETLSKGMQQKVQFIATIVHGPELLILDEPHSGLDPVNQEVLRDTILDARKEGRTVIFSTHNMEQAEQMCEHVCIIAGGEKVLDGNLRDIRRAHRTNHYALAFDEASDAANRFMATWPGFERADRIQDAWEVELKPDADPRALVTAANQLDVALSRFEHVQPSLHEIFVQRVGDAARPRRRPEVAHA
ncbi:ABC transporter ATP-binding protein [Longimicrobium sp.]|uniref:ABC transporter ATP-binding protein n=1 Tax=Longimicrobium sp. TaxID=2029185 RepID=UPI002E36C6A7|nr:ATP-binding cassette domain-containing protein [Longimicrobium sp.]HEX6037195.1 ATP-binding cassette domain-containing protein [Longimicrobium sp.]